MSLSLLELQDCFTDKMASFHYSQADENHGLVLVLIVYELIKPYICVCIH